MQGNHKRKSCSDRVSSSSTSACSERFCSTCILLGAAVSLGCSPEKDLSFRCTANAYFLKEYLSAAEYSWVSFYMSCMFANSIQFEKLILKAFRNSQMWTRKMSTHLIMILRMHPYFCMLGLLEFTLNLNCEAYSSQWLMSKVTIPSGPKARILFLHMLPRFYSICFFLDICCKIKMCFG